MPIWLRTFIFNKIKKFYDDEREANENREKAYLNNTKKQKEIAKPNIPQAQSPPPASSNKSTYVTKASKK